MEQHQHCLWFTLLFSNWIKKFCINIQICLMRGYQTFCQIRKNRTWNKQIKFQRDRKDMNWILGAPLLGTNWDGRHFFILRFFVINSGSFVLLFSIINDSGLYTWINTFLKKQSYFLKSWSHIYLYTNTCQCRKLSTLAETFQIWTRAKTPS